MKDCAVETCLWLEDFHPEMGLNEWIDDLPFNILLTVFQSYQDEGGCIGGRGHGLMTCDFTSF